MKIKNPGPGGNFTQITIGHVENVNPNAKKVNTTVIVNELPDLMPKLNAGVWWAVRNPNGNVLLSLKKPHKVQSPGKGKVPYWDIYDDEDHFNFHNPGLASRLPEVPMEYELTLRPRARSEKVKELLDAADRAQEKRDKQKI